MKYKKATSWAKLNEISSAKELKMNNLATRKNYNLVQVKMKNTYRHILVNF